MTDTLCIKYVYDLRSQTEIDKDAANGGRQVKEWAGSERVFAPVFSHEDYSPEAIAKRFSAFASEGDEVSTHGDDEVSSFFCAIWMTGEEAKGGMRR